MTAPPLLWAYRARLDRIYDADTIYLTCDLGFGVIRGAPDNSYRLLDVWAKEVRGPERPEGLEAKAYALDWFTRHESYHGHVEWPYVVQTVKAKGEEVRSLGRWIATVWCATCGACFNADIVAAGFASATKEGEAEL